MGGNHTVSCIEELAVVRLRGIQVSVGQSVAVAVRLVLIHYEVGIITDAVVIESDGQMQPDPSLKGIEVKTKEDLVAAAKNCGLVGLGGAGFPAHVKLNPSGDTVIDTMIVNAAECEPYITSDYRECMENPEGILKGIYLIKFRKFLL